MVYTRIPAPSNAQIEAIRNNVHYTRVGCVSVNDLRSAVIRVVVYNNQVIRKCCLLNQYRFDSVFDGSNAVKDGTYYLEFDIELI